MYGLRPEVDLSGRLNPFHHPKSQKFSEHLAGRQYVSGISGGFRKTRRQSGEGDDSLVDQAAVATALRQAERRLQKEDQIRKDAMRLREIEDKLEEIRQQKELRKRRDAIRNEKRRQFSAAIIIQNVMKRFLHQNLYRQRLDVAADVVQNYLQAIAAKQAVAAGAWAAAVLARFATRLKLSWVGRKRLARLRLRRQRQQQIERQMLLQEEQELARQQQRLEEEEEQARQQQLLQEEEQARQQELEREREEQELQQELEREREEQNRLQAEREAYLLAEAARASASAAAVEPLPLSSLQEEVDDADYQQPAASPLADERVEETEADEEQMILPVETPSLPISSSSSSSSSSRNQSSSSSMLPGDDHGRHRTTTQPKSSQQTTAVTAAVDNKHDEEEDYESEIEGGPMVEGESAEDRLRRLHDQKIRAREREREKRLQAVEQTRLEKLEKVEAARR